MPQDINITQLVNGRIHLPSSIRREQNLRDGDKFLITVNDNGEIVLKKISKDILWRLLNE